MEYSTRSLKIIVRPDNIVEVSTRKDWDQPDTLETAKENAEAMQKIIRGKRMAVLSYVPDQYISKDVMAYYDSIESDEVANALIANSFGAKLIVNAFLRLTGRSLGSTEKGKGPMKVFSKKEEAVRWLLEILAETK
ncbi:DUF7793 family protein [Aureispira anguillae]|uniref:DUF7793 domain-containing protein n=1 Tax=Aureispira anguillae TaxID=2864201 RepID=A0A916DTF2_9BACT|nr:hypothetical protein [Aureispira anguillae]BDS11441.1 hypothetical protein AsAng_0021550 [Aureispira anguillae]